MKIADLQKALAGAVVGLSLLTAAQQSSGAQTPPVIPPVQQLPNPIAVDIEPPTGATGIIRTPVSMASAIAWAMNRQPAILQARALLTSARGKVIATRGVLLPSLVLTSAYNGIHNLGASNTGGNTSSPGFNEAATVRQLLFDSSHTHDLLNESDKLYISAYFGLKTQENNTALAVSAAYIALCQNVQLTSVSEDNIVNRTSQLALAQARLKSGLGLPSDMVNAQTALAQAQVQLSTAQNAEVASRINLALQMGIDPRTAMATTGYAALPSSSLTAAQVTALALKSRPEIAAEAAQVSAARAAESAARTANDPTVSGNLEVLGRGNSFGGGTGQLIAGVSVQYTPYDGGIVAGQVEQARAAVAQNEALLTGVKLQALSDASTAYAAYESAVQRVDLANAEMFNAKQAVNIATGRYRSGLGLFQDILTAQQSLVTAESDAANALAAAQQAYALVLHAEGQP